MSGAEAEFLRATTAVNDWNVTAMSVFCVLVVLVIFYFYYKDNKDNQKAHRGERKEFLDALNSYKNSIDKLVDKLEFFMENRRKN